MLILWITTRNDEMPMKNPPHPGRIVRQDCLDPLGLTITEGAKVLGVTRQALNNLVNGKSGISPEMAFRLSKAFGSTPEVWLRLQMNYDLAQIREREDEIAVERYQFKEART
jgi:addiction module HigA family antidote